MQAVSAQTPYTEKLNVYVSGADALWYMTFGGLNGSTKLNALESSPGLTSYNLTAVKSTAWSSDFQVFGPGGYNLLPVPFVPSQGAFLSVGSDSFFGDPTRPTGGHVVAHTSTYRLYLRKAAKNRIARMVDSPYHPERDAVFVLDEKGVDDPSEETTRKK